MLRSLASALAFVVAATGAAAALAAPPNKAKALALQKSDFPPSTLARNAGGTVSAGGSGYGVTYLYRTAGKPNELSVSVAVFGSRAVARQMYAESKSEVGSATARLKLPRYGDEQVADFSPLGGSRLIVRTGSVVWVLELQTIVGSRELTKAEALAEYRRYAPKQKRRIEAGRG
jgi:hypothetical protein